mmetsp:Transcript_12437/g.18041  ORF Transcript_12437/g.18041 Transcript_12437/m.18041 type:complete len:228 (-) Transcript_12437:319-1002(-)
MSIPLPRTSVAIRTPSFPDLKLLRFSSRCSWFLPEWITAVRTPVSPSIERETASQPFFVLTKTIMGGSSILISSERRFFFFCSEARNSTFCSTRSADFPVSPTAMITGLLRNFLASLSTAGGIVAENMKVCRYTVEPPVSIKSFSSSGFKLEEGIASSTPWTCGSNPMSIILSASSKTRYLHWFRTQNRLSKQSIIRPGVATTISHPSRSAIPCASMGSPPTTEQTR